MATRTLYGLNVIYGYGENGPKVGRLYAFTEDMRDDLMKLLNTVGMYDKSVLQGLLDQPAPGRFIAVEIPNIKVFESVKDVVIER